MAWWDEVAQQDDERSERLVTCMTGVEAAEFGVGRLAGGANSEDSSGRRWWGR